MVCPLDEVLQTVPLFVLFGLQDVLIGPPGIVAGPGLGSNAFRVIALQAMLLRDGLMDMMGVGAVDVTGDHPGPEVMEPMGQQGLVELPTQTLAAMLFVQEDDARVQVPGRSRDVDAAVNPTHPVQGLPVDEPGLEDAGLRVVLDVELELPLQDRGLQEVRVVVPQGTGGVLDCGARLDVPDGLFEVHGT